MARKRSTDEMAQLLRAVRAARGGMPMQIPTGYPVAAGAARGTISKAMTPVNRSKTITPMKRSATGPSPSPRAYQRASANARFKRTTSTKRAAKAKVGSSRYSSAASRARRSY